MIELIVGCVKKLFNSSQVEKFTPVEKLTPSLMGYYFEHEELKRLMDRLESFETVKFTDVYGERITRQGIDKRFGKDGGIDCIIQIIAPTERGAKNVATRIRNILINGDY